MIDITAVVATDTQDFWLVMQMLITGTLSKVNQYCHE